MEGNIKLNNSRTRSTVKHTNRAPEHTGDAKKLASLPSDWAWQYLDSPQGQWRLFVGWHKSAVKYE